MLSIIDLANKWGGRSFTFSIIGILSDSLYFIQVVMKELGKKIINSLEQQTKEGEEVKKEEMILGDCIYFGNDKGIKCVGLYIGNNKMIYPSINEGKVIEENIDSHKIKKIRRFLKKYKSGQCILNTRTPMKYIDKNCKFY